MSLILNIIFHFLLICLSLHACTSARPLHEGTAGPSLQLISNIKENRPAGDHELMNVKIEEETITLTLSSCCGENKMHKKIFEQLGERKGLATTGSNMELSSEDQLLHHATTKVEDQRRQERTLESVLRPSSDKAEENVGTNKEDHDMQQQEQEQEQKQGEEDIVVMDYAQPHRKPPIHNKEP
ncbi:hypothetical protein M9H77_32874 [Catharanthus roseus]|uniref:Uncharacterized protein n=1 Tax=Catharanthus roseus TaxID=4058 RepID=A0ACC0A5E6_CATRO|nr:hypothetical protein M9H77_32874 [Catharanthus roseus]